MHHHGDATPIVPHADLVLNSEQSHIGGKGVEIWEEFDHEEEGIIGVCGTVRGNTEVITVLLPLYLTRSTVHPSTELTG